MRFRAFCFCACHRARAIFVGRDGTVKLIHAGFAAPASGEFNTQLRSEFESTIERLLAERVSTQDQ